MMVEGIFRRAKQFIGLEEEGEESGGGQQLDLSTILKGKREPRRESAAEAGASIVIYEPKIYEDSLNISTNLRGGSPVIVNLKHLDPSEGTRLIDFVCGTAYAIDGHMLKIGDTIFLFTPCTIAIHSAEERANISEDVAEKRDGFFSR
ncbi:MAG: cell division protein SepF [Candidatus Margulisbacteria bacterium]|jgi:FtsZ-interacting cell division protein YlmF|nr:cell division protein SepF [Candidatus Margulisiibacteriota bacterium]